MTELMLYLLVGGFVTALDITVFNVLCRAPFHWPRLSAHWGATICSMAAGFTLHFLAVFRPHEVLLVERMTRYVLTVLVSAYVVQTAVIYVLSQKWTSPALVFGRLGEMGSSGIVSEELCARNFVKLCAVACGMTVNYASFKFFVYE